MATIEIIGGGGNTPPKDSKPETTESKKLDKLFKKIKKKPLLFGGIIVGLLGLFVWYRRRSTLALTDDTSGEGYFIPTTYTYPQYNGESSTVSDDSYITDVYNALVEEGASNAEILKGSFDESVAQIQDSYDRSTSALVSQVSTLSERVNTTENIVKNQSEAIEKQTALEQMMRNSDRWHYATTQAEKDALHEENKAIADKYGFTFDSEKGVYYDGDNVAYSTPTQEAKTGTIATKTASTSSTKSSTSSTKSSTSSTKSSTSSTKSSTSSTKSSTSSTKSSTSSSKGYVRSDGTKVGNVSSGQQYIGSDGKWHST